MRGKFIFVCCILSSVACALLPEGAALLDSTPTPPTPTETSVPASASTSTPLATPISQEDNEGTADILPEPFSFDEPYAVYRATDTNDPDASYALWASNLTGGEPYLILDEEIEVFALSPSGEYVAAVTNNGTYEPTSFALWLVNLTTSQAQEITRLLQTELTNEIDAMLALSHIDWSDDSTLLAFAAALDGPSTDVYTYDLASGDINRLSSGPTEVGNLLWSPDNALVAQVAVETFGRGAGWTVAGTFVSRADGSGSQELPLGRPEFIDVGQPEFAAWLGPSSLLSLTWSQDCSGLGNLRRIDLSGPTSTALWEDCIGAYAYASEYGVFAVSTSEYVSYTDNQQGIYLFEAGGELVAYHDVQLNGRLPICWIDAIQAFLMIDSTDSFLLVDPDGERLDLPEVLTNLPVAPPDLYYAEHCPSFSPDAERIWYTSNGGLWTADSTGAVQRLTPESLEGVFDFAVNW